VRRWRSMAPARLHDELVAAKRTADLGNAALPQLVLAELMGSGAMERHLRTLRARHRRRRDAMTDAIRRHLPNARVHGAAAGLHLMVTLESRMDDVAIAAAALDRGVKVQPLSWHRQLPGPSGLVLGYAACGSNDIEAGIATLRAVIRRGRG
jgi:GntR family transcriptional regulator / MocR family aminotransferase